jgi:hypothetical protein
MGREATVNAPQLSDEIREQARLAGGGWLDEVVGTHDPAHPVPMTAIKGAWRLDENGELTGEYIANPGYYEEPRRKVVCPYAPRR